MTITLLLGLGAAGCAARGPAPVPAAPAPVSVAAPRPPRLLVTIVVDQLAAWIASERWAALPAGGGFARLQREGLYVRELRYGHAVNDTAPGHSALYTGAVPRESGIVGNEVIRGDAGHAGELVSILADPRTRLVVAGQAAPPVAPQGRPGGTRTASSLVALRVETLADVLSGHDPQAAIYSFSLKDRGTLFGAGRHPTLALWFDPADEAFVTSTAYAAAIPGWVTALGGRDAVRAAQAAPWNLLDRDWVAAHSATRDDQAGEGDYAGLGTTFPHRVSSAGALRATPAGDDLLFALARGAVARAVATPAAVVTRDHPALLALSLSSNDYIGHVFGPDSWEAWDELRRLDEKLAAFLTFLDHAVGPDGYAVMLSGDHGIGALPELEEDVGARAAACRRGAEPTTPAPAAAAGADCPPGQRLLQPQLAAALEAAWQRALGGGQASEPWVTAIGDPLVFLTARARALSAAQRAQLVQTAREALRERFGIDDVVDIRAATGPCPPLADESRAALVCRSLCPDGPGDLYLVVKPRAFFDARYTPGAGAHHGSPYLYDRAVPLLVRAPGRIAPGTVREAPVAFTAFARTAASLLGVPPPAAARDGEDLTAP